MGLFSLDGDQALSLLKRYLPGSLVAGGSIAGLQQLGGMLYQMEKDKKEKQESNDVLTVQIPRSPKEAARNPVGAVVDAVLRDASHAASSGSSAARQVGGSGALSGSAPRPPGGIWQTLKNHPTKSIAAGATIGATGMWQAKHWNDDKGKDPEQMASLQDPGAIAAIIGLGGLGGYGLVNHLIRKRQQKNLEEQLDESKKEYSQLLGASLAKGASAKPAFPIISGICLYKVENDGRPQKEAAASLTHLVGVPTGAFAVSAILAHRWMHERQKELEKMHTESKPAPPKQIRLVTAPQIEEEADGEKPLALGFEKGAAQIPDWFEFFNKVPVTAQDDLAAKQLQKQQDEDEKKQPKMTNVAPGTVQIALRDGSVEVLAEDPNAAKILSKASPRLTKLLAAFQSTPAELR